MDKITDFTEEIFRKADDPRIVKYLLCFLLKRLNFAVSSEQLYEISVPSGLINYFDYCEAINSLKASDNLVVENKDDTEFYSLSEKGKELAEILKRYAPRALRDKLLECALRYFARQRIELDSSADIVQSGNGYHVTLKFHTSGMNLMSLELYAPDEDQAKYIARKMQMNPMRLYQNIINYVLLSKEEDIVIDE